MNALELRIPPLGLALAGGIINLIDSHLAIRDPVARI